MANASLKILNKDTNGAPPVIAEAVVSTNDHRLVVRDFLGRAPKTRYYGSKRKLLGWLHEALAPLHFESVLDLFGGTASVSLLLKAMGKKVTYHDGLTFNTDVASTLLADAPALDRQWVENFASRVQPTTGPVTRIFEGIFFTADENEWIDGYMSAQAAPTLGPQERALLRYLLYQACLKKRPFNLFHRANLTIRTRSDVKRSFGNLTTWNRPFAEHILDSLAELESGLVNSGPKASVLLPSSAESVQAGYDLVYLDPPYVGRRHSNNRDNYWRKYHFLEGLARYDQWPDLINHQSRTKMIEEPAWSREWTNHARFRELLLATIERHRASIVVLSYVSDGVPDHVELFEHFKALFREVSVSERDYQYAMSGRKKRELLFVGLP